MNIRKLIKRAVYRNRILYSLLIWKNKKKANGNVLVENGGGYGRFERDIVGDGNVIKIGSETVLLNPMIRIHGNNNMIIFGSKCHVGSNCSFWMEGNNIQITIGANTTFTHDDQLCAQEDGSCIIVGEDCMFSNRINVRTSDSHPIYSLDTGERINPSKSVTIGDHVWIAPNSKIMKGASVGSGSVIGTDAMIFHDIPENSLAVGQPAKVVKQNIGWTREALF